MISRSCGNNWSLILLKSVASTVEFLKDFQINALFAFDNIVVVKT